MNTAVILNVLDNETFDIETTYKSPHVSRSEIDLSSIPSTSTSQMRFKLMSTSTALVSDRFWVSDRPRTGIVSHIKIKCIKSVISNMAIYNLKNHCEFVCKIINVNSKICRLSCELKM